MDHYERESMVDVTLSCQGKFLKAHKMVLGACSPYFEELFALHQSSQQPVIIIMNGFEFEDIRALIEFMYKGEVRVRTKLMEIFLNSIYKADAEFPLFAPIRYQKKTWREFWQQQKACKFEVCPMCGTSGIQRKGIALRKKFQKVTAKQVLHPCRLTKGVKGCGNPKKRRLVVSSSCVTKSS